MTRTDSTFPALLNNSCHSAPPVPARGDGLDRRGDDRPAVGDDLEPEADVDPVLLEKAAAQGCARQPRPGEFREERASANEDLTAPRRQESDLVRRVLRVHDN